jgi:peptidoglycan/xylan/chitin deacetylase (PgdA/CDA1 family)
MRNKILIFILLGFAESAFSQNPKEFVNTNFLKKLNSDVFYSTLKKRIVSEYSAAKPGQWGEFINGVNEKIITQNKIIAFTFDACGGKNGKGYDKELIDFLHNEKIQATLFVTGKWIDANFTDFLNLSRDTLFEIENHGLNHRPCSIDGKSAYGIQGTSGAEEAFDEIEANARKIAELTKKDPVFYRSATAFIDEACVRMAGDLGFKVISYQVLSGDAVPFLKDSVIVENVLRRIKPGAIVIMHFNHPEWNTFEAMQKIVPKLREKGYMFVKLKGFEVTGNKN